MSVFNRVSIAVFGVTALLAGCFEPAGVQKREFCPGGLDLASMVDPLIGTAGPGNSLPSAMVPHGMVRVGPDTTNEPGSVDAYSYGSDLIEGFTHTNWQGPGGSGNGYSHVLLVPVTGGFKSDVNAWSSRFNHDSEVVEPGYYAVTLEDPGVRVELTASGHAAIHKYRYLENEDEKGLILDLGHSLGDSKGGFVQAVGSTMVRGYAEYNVHPLIDLLLNRGKGRTGFTRVYFHIEFEPSFESFSTLKRNRNDATIHRGQRSDSGAWLGAYMSFGRSVETVEVRIGLSLISVEQAEKNLKQEIGGKGFEEVEERARAAWNCLLNRVRVKGGTREQRVMFYTSLYRTSMQPADYTEAGGVYFTAADQVGEVFHADPGRSFYTDDWCAWDTFRTSRPLATLVEPAIVSDVVASYLHLFEQGGWLPKCPWQAAGYSRVMIGNHGVSIVADALAKGLDSFDRELAWQALYKEAMEDNEEDFYEGACGYANLGTTREYVEKGYVSHECDITQSASMTLEYAYNDWCTARAAHALGLADMEKFFDKRAKNYRNQWNPKTGFMQGRHRDGRFVEPFDPADWSDANDFCEASPWIYTFFVPHDVEGLVQLMGGTRRFLEKLDEFFKAGEFDISNEPSFHIPFLYAEAGEPAKTYSLVEKILKEDFSPDPDGLPGNDDSGATSAWYVLSSIGLYPVAPGNGLYRVLPPAFEEVAIYLDPAVYPGKVFTIRKQENPGLGPNEFEVTLNGRALDDGVIRHSDIVSGGELVVSVREL